MNPAHFSVEFIEAVWPSLPEEAQGRLESYMADLLRYNRAQNLVSRKSPERRIAALVEESVAAGLVAGRRGLGGVWADVGSGGGIPGLVLACLFPEQRIVLIERRQGRCDFLRREVRALELSRVEVFEGDVRAWPGDRFGVVFAKAVANPGEIEILCDSVVGHHLLVFGRVGDPVAEGWGMEWEELLPADAGVLRSLARR